MKPEPLKDKAIDTLDHFPKEYYSPDLRKGVNPKCTKEGLGSIHVFEESDVKSAVEWLKKEILKKAVNDKKEKVKWIYEDILWFNKKVDEAFSDVIEWKKKE